MIKVSCQNSLFFRQDRLGKDWLKDGNGNCVVPLFYFRSVLFDRMGFFNAFSGFSGTHKRLLIRFWPLQCSPQFFPFRIFQFQIFHKLLQSFPKGQFFQSRVVRLNYFKASRVNPLIKYFCRNKKTIMVGATAISAAAFSIP